MDNSSQIESFNELGIGEALISRLENLNIKQPTAVQKKVIPSITEGKNIIFQSETGTGKTFAFLLPLLEKIEKDTEARKTVQIIIVSPTFELSSQLKEAVQSVTELKAALFIGGSPIKRQLELLKDKPEIVIGNPARLLELIRLKKLKISTCKAVILDECDRLFTKEIIDETTQLLECFQKQVQFIACSATLSNKTKKVLENFRENIEAIELPSEDVLRVKITHWALYAERRDKIDTLRSLLHALEPEKALIFTSRADQVENIASKLRYRKIPCESLHARTKNQERKASMDRFRSGKTRILITSDLASRGLDIKGITHVIQMDLPKDTDFFVHRSGRTARCGSTGINIVIGDEFELRQYAALEKKFKFTVYPKALHKGKIVNAAEIDPESI